MDDLWSNRYTASTENLNVIFNTDGLGDMAHFFVYLFVAVLVGGAVIYIFVGGLKMFLAGSHEDDFHSARHTFYTSIISLIVAVALFLSLDYIFALVDDLSKRIS